MRPRAIYAFGSIVFRHSDGRLPHFYTIWNYGQTFGIEAPEWVRYVSIHFNTKVSNIDVSRSCISIKCEDKCVRFAAISIIIVWFDCNMKAVRYSLRAQAVDNLVLCQAF